MRSIEKAAVGRQTAKVGFVRYAAIQHAEILRSWTNVRYAGCDRSIRRLCSRSGRAESNEIPPNKIQVGQW